jgi:hypothetical protein
MQTRIVRKIINAILLGKETCGCVDKVKVLKQQTSENDPKRSTALIYSERLRNSLGGRTSFGISGQPIELNYLGRREGQSGGSGTPLRNQF